MKKYLPPIVCGFGAGIIYIIPYTKGLTCCLVIPIAAIISLFLDQKARGRIIKINYSQGVLFGALTGVFAALFGSFFDVLITFITRTNIIVESLSEYNKLFEKYFNDPEMIKQIMSIYNSMAENITEHGFSLMYTLTVFTGNFLINPIFGLIGGLIGVKMMNSRNKNLLDKY